MKNDWSVKVRAAALAGMCLLVLCVFLVARAQNAANDPWAVTNTSEMPRYKWDASWPKPLPNKWKLGGITGLAVDKDDNVWVHTRPNDTLDVEGRFGLNPPIADCCVRPPSMIHIDKNGTVIGSFDAPQGHGMDVDSQGFVYLGNNVPGRGNTVRKYDPKTGQMVKELARAPENQPGGGGGAAAADAGAAPAAGGAPAAGAGRGAAAGAGRGGAAGAAAGAGRGGAAGAGRGGAAGAPPPDPAAVAAQQAAQAAAIAAYRAKYPPTSPFIVGGLEEIRLDESVREMYVADNYLGGRVMVFDMDTFAFKRGWGARGTPLAEISTNDADRAYTPNGPMPKNFAGHLTFNFSNDGLVYAADRNANRICVTDKQGKFVKEFTLATSTGNGGSTGGVGFSADRQQKYLFISDLTNSTVWFLNREDGKVLGRMGNLSDQGGQFYSVHMIAVDSRGYIYTGEVQQGERVQRHVPENVRINPADIELVSKVTPTGDPWSVTPAPNMPRFRLDPDWPKPPLPNHWKMGGITGLAVDKDDNVWVHTRPNDTLDVEGRFGLTPPTAACCVRPPSMIHIDKNGNVIGSFNAPQGHGMDVDSQGFIYLGNTVDGKNTIHKYDPKTGQVVKAVPRAPENQPGGAANNAEATAAFRAKYPPTTPMIVGQLEEIRLDEAARELYAADSYLGGRVMVFDLDTFAFKRGWGAYGKPLAQISTNDADHDYTPNGPMPKDFAGHLTLNFSNDGKVYAADRNANRIHVTDKQGKYLGQEFVVAPATGAGGSTGGVGFSTDRQQQFLYISDLTNNTIWFLNRADGKVLGRMGSMGDQGGQFYGVHMIAVDSRGNIYTGEVQNGERVQRFVPAN